MWIPLALYFVAQAFTQSIVSTPIGLGVVGAWYAMTIDIIVRASLLAWRFFHGGWQHLEV